MMDFDELAKKYGGQPVAGTSKYDELAKRFGGKLVTQEEPSPPKDEGFFTNVGKLAFEGGERAIGAARVSPSVISGSVGKEQADVIAQQLGMKPSVQPKELTEAQTAFRDEAQALQQAKGFSESVGPTLQFMAEFGKQALTNPKGVAYLTAQSAANMAPSIAGMIAGGKLGAMAGTAVAPGPGTAIGGVSGAIAGGFAGSAPMEIGAEFIDRVGDGLRERNLEPTKENVEALLSDKDFVAKAVSEARTKGATTASVDAIMTAGAGRYATGPRRAAIKAAQTEMGAAADAAAIAKRADEILKQGTKAERAARAVKRGAGAVGIDVAGGGLSEAAGQYAAYGKIDPESVALEMLGELGGAGIEVPSAAYATTRDALKTQAKKEAARILEEERAAAAQVVSPEVQQPEPATDLADLEKQFGMGSVAPTQEDLIREIEQPPAEPKESEAPSGFVRVYHSGSAGEGETGRWASTDKNYASNYRPDLPLFYTDIPADDPRVNNPDYPDQGVGQGFTFNFELTPEEASRLKEIPREEQQKQEAKKEEAYTPPLESIRIREEQEKAAAERAAIEKADEAALAEIDKPFSVAEEMEGVPAPRLPEVEAEIEKLTKDQQAAQAERTKLEKRTAGTSLMQVLKGTLNDNELSELGGRARKVGKNPFLNLKASKGQAGVSMEDMVDSGRLDIFLPEKMRPGHPDYVNSESAEYIRDKLRNNQFYTYETELAIQRIDQDLESIERQIQDLLSDDEINKEIQYAVDEQRELDQATEEPAAEEADRAAAERQEQAPVAEPEQAQQEAERAAGEAVRAEEAKPTEEERVKTEEPAAEPEPIAISTEQEKEEALNLLDKLLATPVPPFKGQKGDGRTVTIKPKPLTKEEQALIRSLVNDAIDLGMPPSLVGNIVAAGSTRMDVVAAVTNPTGWLLLGKDWAGTTKAEKITTMIHELAHRVDSLHEGKRISDSKEWNECNTELKDWYEKTRDRNHPLTYPFSSYFKGKVRLKQESFAQAFALYFVDPVALQTNAPVSYSEIQNIVERIHDESQQARAAGTAKAGTAGIKIYSTRAGKGAEVQPVAGEERAGVSGAERDEARAAAKVTETPAFKRWFGKSVVANSKREPIVVYHGTDALDEYEDGEAISQFKDYEPIWAARNPVIASGYATSKLRQANIEGSKYAGSPTMYPVYMSIQNPLVLTFDMNAGPRGALEIAKRIGAKSSSFKDAEYAWQIVNTSEFAEAARNQGYDGIVAQENGEQTYAALNPSQIKSATGNRGTFDAESQDINAMEAEPRARENVLGQPVLGSWTEPTDTKLIGEVGKDDIIYALQDKLIDTKRVVQAITAKAGKIANQWNPYLQEELYHGRTAKETGDFLRTELRPLMQDMHRDGITIGEFEQYLHNRHAEAYNRQVAKVNPNNPEMQDGGSGIATEDARKYLSDLPDAKRKQYEALAAKLDGITKGTRELLVKSGLESKETIEAWEKAFPDYVPLHREDVDFQYTTSSTGTGQGFDVRGPFSRRAMGSKRNVVDILANVAMQRERAIVKANKNRVAQATYGLAIQQPNPDFWLAVNPEAEKVPEAAIEELRSMGIDEGAIEFLMKEPKQRAIDPKKNEVMSRINAVLRNNDSVLSTRVNGQNRYVFFNPNNDRSARAAKALKNLDADQLGRVLGKISKITRWMASVNTQYNPIFGAYNFLRDTQGAALQLSDTPLAGKQKEVLSNSIPALRAIYSAIRGERKGKNVDTEMAKLWEDFQKAGGQTGFRDMYSRSQERSEALQKELQQMSEGKLKHAGRAVFEWLSDYNDTMENAVRLAAYKTALDNGISRDEAASIAKNLTVNFNRKGQIGVQAGALYAFFNAGVQGTARLAQTLKGPAGKKIIAGGLLLGAMQASLLAMAGFDDEEPPEFVRERNIIIPIGGSKYIALPMPLGYHVIPGTSRILTEWALSGFKDTPEKLTSLTGMYLDAFNPIGNAGWSVQTIAPTFADPLVALAENKDWTGKPIARKDFSNLDPTPGYTRAKDAATWYATQIAKFLNFATGGTKYQPGVISPTPDQIDYLIGQATGGVGREIGKLATTAEKAYTGEELPVYKIPLVGRFYGETKSSAAESSRFYKNLEHVNKLENEIKGRRENKEPVGDFLSKNPEARLAKRGREIYQDIKKLRERKSKLLERNAPRESVKIVEEQITRKMKMFNDQMESAKK